MGKLRPTVIGGLPITQGSATGVGPQKEENVRVPNGDSTQVGWAVAYSVKVVVPGRAGLTTQVWALGPVATRVGQARRNRHERQSV